jgi:hypothetical protein
MPSQPSTGKLPSTALQVKRLVYTNKPTEWSDGSARVMLPCHFTQLRLKPRSLPSVLSAVGARALSWVRPHALGHWIRVSRPYDSVFRTRPVSIARRAYAQLPHNSTCRSTQCLRSPMKETEMRNKSNRDSENRERIMYAVWTHASITR